MPEGNDPYGTQAYNQQLSKELRCSAHSLKARQQFMQIPVDVSRTYIVTNPVTHQDTVIRIPVEHGGKALRPPASSVAAVASTRADSRNEGTMPSSFSMKGPTPSPSVASSRRSVNSIAPPSTVGGGSSRRTQQHEKLEQRLHALELTLDEERAGRHKVQVELARLQTMLERTLAENNK
jgi:hypothetical protein